VFSVECGVFSDIPPAASTMFKGLKLVGSRWSFSLSSPMDLPAMAWRFPVVAGGGQRLGGEVTLSRTTNNRRRRRFPVQRWLARV
jgi:hypothetical protein